MKRLLVLILFVLLLAGGALAWAYSVCFTPGPATNPVNVVIAKGSRTLDIGQALQESGVIRSKWLFVAAAQVQKRRLGGSIKAGEYVFTPEETLRDTLAQLRAGRVVVHRVTVPEGLTNLQIAAILTAAPDLAGDVGELPEEGHLWPETYEFTRGDTRASVVHRMRIAAERELDEAWKERDAALPLKTRAEALVLASIVERETGVASERALVARVFYNRLTNGMHLQSDPTLIYAESNGLGVIDHPLGKSELGAVSPYNTYLNAGLPPHPICNPGKASLLAVMHPAAGDELYFVATGVGGHAFAANLADHNRNVAHYVKVIREKAALTPSPPTGGEGRGEGK